ncbi:MAG: TRAP transporter permease [Variibacter sp.]
MAAAESGRDEAAARAELETMVAEADLGGRKPTGPVAQFLFIVAICWSCFQLWYASPLPFKLGIGIFNDTEARALHLAFALLLAFTLFPAFKRSPRAYIPLADWVFALGGAVASLYLIVFYREISQRPGLPTVTDIVIACIGVLLLLEAARRAVGPALAVIAALMLGYTFAGPWMPGIIAHKGASLARAASQYWLTSEGIFGVALGVSTSFVFLYVLFGTLLERAGAGNFFIQIAFSLLGNFRGGPAKAAVVSSGMTGMISGSSIANVVTTGTFTIPLMKRVGYSPIKAGAIECAAGVNGQLMPPVMGAAAFLIAEYVGISYAEVVRHAILPALLTYGSLFYIVDIEAMKAGMRGLPRTRTEAVKQGILKALLTFCGLVILAALIYWGVGWTKTLFGDAASVTLGILIAVAYVVLMAYRARYPDLPADDPTTALSHVPDFYEVARTGVHYLIPVCVLIWCLMVEEMSPGLSAFYGTTCLIALVLTQHPLTAFFRGERRLSQHWINGGRDLVTAFELGARNMIGVGIATAAAGIIVGTVSLTGIGLVMTEIVEFLSGGNLVIMLLLTAAICIVLGMGMPTTASYVVVATLMAPVLVDIAAQNDIAVPLIAVHMFVFYFGLMADVTPPVGLAAYAAAAISGADPVKTGVQGFRYEIRTGLLPFIFIFNTQLLMIDIGGWVHFAVVVACSTLAMAAFVAASQNWLLTRNRWYETVLLLLICFTLFRPGFWLDRFSEPYTSLPASQALAEAEKAPAGSAFRLRVAGQDARGDPTEKLVRLTLGKGSNAREKLAGAGLVVMQAGDQVTVQSTRLGSEARKYGIQPGDEIRAVVIPTDRPSSYWFAIPAIALFAGIVLLQRRRRSLAKAPVPAHA